MSFFYAKLHPLIVFSYQINSKICKFIEHFVFPFVLFLSGLKGLFHFLCIPYFRISLTTWHLTFSYFLLLVHNKAFYIYKIRYSSVSITLNKALYIPKVWFYLVVCFRYWIVYYRMQFYVLFVFLCRNLNYIIFALKLTEICIFYHCRNMYILLLTEICIFITYRNMYIL